MVSNKLPNGMTLITVMFALAIAGSILTPIFITQTALMERIADTGMAIQRIMAAEQFLCETEFKLLQDEMPASEKKMQKPQMTLAFKEKKPVQGSALAKFHNIMLHEVSWEWEFNRVKKKDQLVVLVFKPEEKKQ